MRIFFMTFWPRRWKFMTGKESRENFPFLKKLVSMGRNLYQPTPHTQKNPNIYILSFFPDLTRQDDISLTLKYGKFLRNVTNLFFISSFIVFISLCLLLFVNVSCKDYYTLITFFPRVITLSHPQVIIWDYCYNYTRS